MTIYINSIAAISPNSVPGKTSLPGALVCGEPDLSEFFEPKQTRRMSHVIKMGIGAAMDAVRSAGNMQPDAIITATAYGCLDDTEVFLKKQVQQQEAMLTPTAFIQSTHNTVGGQIGLVLKANCYNNTIVHRGFSFEQSLQDATMLLQEGAASQVLVGGVDELTATSHKLLSRFGIYRKPNDGDAPGVVAAGEGAAFFVLSGELKTTTQAIFNDLAIFYKPAIGSLPKTISDFLASSSLSPADIDVIIAGKNGNVSGDKIYDDVLGQLFQGKNILSFKDECGEYPTATAYAFYKAAKLLQAKDQPVKHVLIYNHYLEMHHALFLLSAC